MRIIWEFPKIRGILGFLLKGSYKGSIKGLGFREFPKIRGVPYFGGPYNKDPTI